MKVEFLPRKVFRRRRHVQIMLKGDEPPAVSIELIPGADGTRGDFFWECPGCGHAYWGPIGDTPRSGWDNPQWVLTNFPEAPTLEPSLGCSRWHNGTCSDGHWFLRDGELVRA